MKFTSLELKALRAENKTFSRNLQPVPRSDWPESHQDISRLIVWRSREFLVQVFSVPGNIFRISVSRSDLDKSGRWKDGISWDDLQRIKSEIGFGNVDAVEVYPADRNVVNVANIRHLWVMPEPVPFAWRRMA